MPKCISPVAEIIGARVSKLADAVERAEQHALENPPNAIERVSTGGDYHLDILRAIGLDPDNIIARAVVAVSNRYGLDPMLGHIAIIAHSQMPYVTRDGYLFVAHRSQQFDGMTVVDGPRREGAEWVATVAVYRKDMGHPFTYPGRCRIDQENGPEMAITRAERRALKRAFAVTLPQEFGDDDRPGARSEPRPVRDVQLPAPSATETAEPAEVGTSAPSEPEIRSEGVGEPDAAEVPGGAVPEIAPRQRRAIFTECNRLGIAGDESRDQRIALISGIVGRDIGSTTELSEPEASGVITALRDLQPQEHWGQYEKGQTQ